MSYSALFEFFMVASNLVIFSFIGYYLLSLRAKEKDLQEKEGKADTSYHQVVDDALTRERKIMDDATSEADKIIMGAQYITDESKEAINKALKDISVSIQTESVKTAQTFMNNYQDSLTSIVSDSIEGFRKVNQELALDLKLQVKQVHESLLPTLERELEEYKQSRLKETDRMIISIIQKASQEILNKSIPLADHQKLLIDSLEKAKREGVFG